MWWIVYRIIVPGILLIAIFCFAAFRGYKSYKKKKSTKKKIAIFAYLCIALIGLVLSFIASLDLIYQDFIFENGQYKEYHRNRDVIELIFNVKGEDERCFIFPTELRKFDLHEGDTYQFIYAKRTGMLISINRKE